MALRIIQQVMMIASSCRVCGMPNNHCIHSVTSGVARPRLDTHREDQGDEIEVVDDGTEQALWRDFSPTSGTSVELGLNTSILRTKKK